jgi:undecaprenyl diphosphate synthase
MEHIAFIMDGNRTWAKERMLPSFEWHRRWYENTKKIIRLVKKRGIPYVSIWALSDDNIMNRSKEEVKYLFELLTKGMLDIAKEAKEEWNKIVVVWDRSLLPKKCLDSIEYAEKTTKDGTWITTIVAIAYGGQEEIVRAIKKMVSEGIQENEITKDSLKTFIETAEYPPPDLIVRTGGHIRHSGFFLFQSPYAEYHFSEKNWPEFDECDLDSAIEWFQKSKRNFGK